MTLAGWPRPFLLCYEILGLDVLDEVHEHLGDLGAGCLAGGIQAQGAVGVALAVDDLVAHGPLLALTGPVAGLVVIVEVVDLVVVFGLAHEAVQHNSQLLTGDLAVVVGAVGFFVITFLLTLQRK